MKTKAKASHVFELRLWSKKHFIGKGTITKPKGTDMNIWSGHVIDVKTKKGIIFNRMGDCINEIERRYKEDEKMGL